MGLCGKTGQESMATRPSHVHSGIDDRQHEQAIGLTEKKARSEVVLHISKSGVLMTVNPHSPLLHETCVLILLFLTTLGNL